MANCDWLTLVNDVFHAAVFLIVGYLGYKGVKLSPGTKKLLQDLLDNQTVQIQNGFTAQNKKPAE